jgi:hypothetical protein
MREFARLCANTAVSAAPPSLARSLLMRVCDCEGEEPRMSGNVVGGSLVFPDKNDQAR